MRKRPFQFRLAAWFWLSLVIAAFFLGRNWDSLRTAPTTGSLMFGAGVNSDAGVTGQIVVDETNFGAPFSPAP